MSDENGFSSTRLKAYDLAGEYAKQLLTLSAAILTASVLLVQAMALKFGWVGSVTLLFAWVLLGLSTLAGVRLLARMTGELGAETPNPLALFDSINDLAKIQGRLFLGGLIALFIFGLVAVLLPAVDISLP